MRASKWGDDAVAKPRWIGGVRTLAVLAAAALVPAGCAAQGDSLATGFDEPAASEAPRPAPGLRGGKPDADRPDVLAVVAGAPITTEDFLARLMHRESRAVFDTLDRQVSAHLALLEAQRLGVQIDPAVVDAEVAASVESMTAAVEGAGFELERYLAEQLGLDPERYFQILRDEVMEQLLTERVMRAWILGQPRVVLRVIVTEQEDAALAAKARIEAGDAFEVVAAGTSIDPTAANGGLLPPMVRSELSPMSRLAFQTPVGTLAGPLEQDRHFILLMPVEVLPAQAGAWDVLGPAVEESLAADPPQDAEFWQWRAAMGRRYQVDLTPLLKLAGEPSADLPE